MSMSMWRSILSDVDKSIKIISKTYRIYLKLSSDYGKLRIKCHIFFLFKKSILIFVTLDVTETTIIYNYKFPD